MATKVPRDLAAFRLIHGVGKAKLEGYGPVSLREIEAWLTQDANKA